MKDGDIMKVTFYRKLQDDFAVIRDLQHTFDQKRYDAAVISIKEARKKIKMHAIPSEKKILLYCIDTLFAILNEGIQQKICDFTDAIHNIPEIYMQKRNLYSCRKELKAFQKKYGRHYFTFIDEVKPYFSRKAPNNKWAYFSAASDEDFKKLHPVGYRLLCVIGIAALMLPQVIYLYCIAINPAPNEWPLALGYVGTFVMGIGLFNIVAAWIHQYLGHLLTAICMLGGAALTLCSIYLLYA